MSTALHTPGSAEAADLTVRACVLLQEAIEADSLGRVNTAAGLIEDAQHALAQIETSPGRVVTTELAIHGRIAASNDVFVVQLAAVNSEVAHLNDEAATTKAALAAANAEVARLRAYTATLRATSFEAVTALREIVTETMDFPPVRPTSNSSWLPQEMVAKAQAALAPFQLDVPVCRAMGAPATTPTQLQGATA